jgi:hypothetical protein
MQIHPMKQIQQHYVDCIERLKGGAIDRGEWGKLYAMLDELTEGGHLISQIVPPNSKFARARILSSGNKFPSIRELGYPSEKLCSSFGRCNKPGAPVLYAGVGTELLFSEIGAQIGDLVGILHMSPIRDLPFVRLGALNLWRRTSGECSMEDDLKKQIKIVHKDPNNIVEFLLDAFISDYFTRIGSPNTYKLTSAFTSVILDSRSDIAGLIYDSVNHTAGACLAIKPKVFESDIKPTEVQIVRITSYLGYGIYDFEQLEIAEEFDGESIVWS